MSFLLNIINRQMPMDSEIRSELYEICEREHSSCNSGCPVFLINGNAIPDSAHDFKKNRGCDCFKDGSKMLYFIRKELKEKEWKCFNCLESKGTLADSTEAPLSVREMEVLSYAARGYSNKQIANLLYVSTSTIKTHFSLIFRKIGANDRTHAVVMAIQFGWITIYDKEDE